MSKELNVKANYFDEKEEQAIIDYINSDNQEERSLIYKNFLEKALNRMIISIMRRYPLFYGDFTESEIFDMTIYHLLEALSKKDRVKSKGFDKSRGKAYSYCGTICRNFLKNFSKDNYDEKTKKNVIDICDESSYNYIENKLSMQNDYVDEIEPISLINDIITEIKKEIKINKTLTTNEIKVGQSLLHVLENYEYLLLNSEVPIKEEPTKRRKKNLIYKTGITNLHIKNKIFFIIRDMTALHTSEIRKGMNKFKSIYKILKTKKQEE
jgi:hypothetical protein